MAMGRDGGVQPDLMVTWADIPRSPGHVFYDRLQKLGTLINVPRGGDRGATTASCGALLV